MRIYYQRKGVSGEIRGPRMKSGVELFHDEKKKEGGSNPNRALPPREVLNGYLMV